MTVFLIVAAALYLWGCVIANRAIRHSTHQYDTGILVRGTLMSWWAVLLMRLG